MNPAKGGVSEEKSRRLFDFENTPESKVSEEKSRRLLDFGNPAEGEKEEILVAGLKTL